MTQNTESEGMQQNLKQVQNVDPHATTWHDPSLIHNEVQDRHMGSQSPDMSSHFKGPAYTVHIALRFITLSPIKQTAADLILYSE